MKVDDRFASRVAELAAEMVCDGWPHGTFDNPDFVVLPGGHFEGAVQRAAHHIWGGPGWWRLNTNRALKCMQSIRWLVCDDSALPHAVNEKLSRDRWDQLDADETVLMLLFAARALKPVPVPRAGRSIRAHAGDA